MLCLIWVVKIPCLKINKTIFKIREESQQMIKPEFRLDGYPPRNSLESSRTSLQPSRISVQPSRISLQPSRIASKPSRISLQPSRDSSQHSRNSFQPPRDSFQLPRYSLKSSRSSLEQSTTKPFIDKELHLEDLGCLDPSEYDGASTTFESLTPDATSTPSQISKVRSLEFNISWIF